MTWLNWLFIAVGVLFGGYIIFLVYVGIKHRDEIARRVKEKRKGKNE